MKNKQGENAPKYNHYEGLRNLNDYEKFETTGPIDEQGENAPIYNHYEGLRNQNDYEKFETTGPIDENGDPIRAENDTKDDAGPSDIHDEDSFFE